MSDEALLDGWIELDVKEAPAELRRLSAAVGAFAGSHALPQRTADALELVLEEALTNVVMHGFPSTPAAPRIRVRITREPAHVRAVIADNGCAFDPTAAAELSAPLPVDAAGGRGIRIMRRLSDDMSYRRRDGWNELQLTWRCPDPPVGTTGPASKERS